MNSMHLGTAHLSDEAFVKAFESCRLPAGQFHHADHIRLAWIYLRELGEDLAAARIEQAIRGFAAHNGISEKYHHTITLAWLRLVAGACRMTPETRRFEDFAERHPRLLAVRTLSNYYSAERLATIEARAEWVEPDLCSLP
jgi:hypothetical protein